MSLIPPRVHGVIDYLVGALLLAAPWLLGFSDDPAATWVTVAFGAVAILYSVTTDYELGVVPVLSMRTHLVIDIVWAVLLLASPWIFGFADRVRWPHVIVALAGLAVTAMTWRPAGHATTGGVLPERTRWWRSRARMRGAAE